MSKQANNKKQNQAQSPKGKSKPVKQSSFFERLLGVITLNRAIYREIAEDTNGTTQAVIVVIVVALLVGAINYFANTQLPGLPDQAGASAKPLSRAVVMVVQELLIWGAGSFVIAAVAKNMFGGSTNTGEMLRVFGFTRVFQLLLVLGVFSSALAAIVSIAGLALGIIGSIIGIREAANFTMGKAAVVAVFSIVLVSTVIAFFTAFVLNPFFTILLPT